MYCFIVHFLHRTITGTGEYRIKGGGGDGRLSDVTSRGHADDPVFLATT